MWLLGLVWVILAASRCCQIKASPANASIAVVSTLSSGPSRLTASEWKGYLAGHTKSNSLNCKGTEGTQDDCGGDCNPCSDECDDLDDPSCCDGHHVDLDSDDSNCGSCDHQCCSPTPDCCGGDCVDTLTDSFNCGSCNPCPIAGQLCCAGVCTPVGPGNCGSCGQTCGAGQLCCNGACTSVLTDPLHCGSCTNQCDPTTQLCCVGSCVPSSNTQCASCGVACTGGTQCCNKACVDVETDENNCGRCGNKCGPTQQCCLGGCKNVLTDNNNCGTCGSVCNAPTPDCCEGSCTDFQTDNDNCGACGNNCPPGQQCSNGECCPNGHLFCPLPLGRGQCCNSVADKCTSQGCCPVERTCPNDNTTPPAGLICCNTGSVCDTTTNPPHCNP